MNELERSAARQCFRSGSESHRLVSEPSEELERLLRIRVRTSLSTVSLKWKAYVERVSAVKRLKQASEKIRGLGHARYLYKLMAYKDEYEVADFTGLRLFNKQSVTSLEIKAKSPTSCIPLMKRLGLEQKIGLGRSGDVAFAILRRMKFLRGTPLDIFGNTAHRKMERGLVNEYQTMIEAVVDGLHTDSYDKALRVAELPDMIRGYEGVKEANVEKFRQAAKEILN